MATLRRAIAGDQQRGIVTQRIEIVGIRIAGGDAHHPRRDHGGVGVRDEQRVARVGQVARHHVGDAAAVRDLAQHDQSAVRGEVAGILRGCERLALHG